MIEVKTMKAFVQQRLTAVAEEIFELFEKTVADYEEQLLRQRKLMDTVHKSPVRSSKPDVQLMLVNKEVHPQQQNCSTLDQDDPPELPQIKKEQEEPWSGPEGDQLQDLEEADITMVPFTPVIVKCEDDDDDDDEETSQSSEFHHTEDQTCNPEIHSRPDTDDETSNDLEPEVEGGCDLEKTREPESVLNDKDPDCNTGKTSVSSSECSTSFNPKRQLQEHSGTQKGEKTFSCSICGKKYNWKKSLTAHMRLHSEGNGFSCPFCKKTFPFRGQVVMHMRVHTGEKPFSCTVCGRTFTQKGTLRGHMRIHTGEKPSSCTVCGRKFGKNGNLREHMKTHTGEKAFSCSICGKEFGFSGNLTQHMRVHTGEKPFSCSVCNKSFTRHAHMKKHKCAGESSESK